MLHLIPGEVFEKSLMNLMNYIFVTTEPNWTGHSKGLFKRMVGLWATRSPCHYFFWTGAKLTAMEHGWSTTAQSLGTRGHQAIWRRFDRMERDDMMPSIGLSSKLDTSTLAHPPDQAFYWVRLLMSFCTSHVCLVEWHVSTCFVLGFALLCCF